MLGRDGWGGDLEVGVVPLGTSRNSGSAHYLNIE